MRINDIEPRFLMLIIINNNNSDYIPQSTVHSVSKTSSVSGHPTSPTTPLIQVLVCSCTPTPQVLEQAPGELHCDQNTAKNERHFRIINFRIIKTYDTQQSHSRQLLSHRPRSQRPLHRHKFASGFWFQCRT